MISFEQLNLTCYANAKNSVDFPHSALQTRTAELMIEFSSNTSVNTYIHIHMLPHNHEYIHRHTYDPTTTIIVAGNQKQTVACQQSVKE